MGRRIDEILDSFFFGFYGGFGYLFLKHVNNSPKGFSRQMMLDPACLAGLINAPQLTGFAVLVTTMFCTVDSTMEYVRQKDDILNKITAGAASTGLLKIPRGLSGASPATRSVVLGSAFTGLFLTNVHYKAN